MACTHSRTRVNAAICANLLGTTAVGSHCGTLVSPDVASTHARSGSGFGFSFGESHLSGQGHLLLVGIRWALLRTRVPAAVRILLFDEVASGTQFTLVLLPVALGHASGLLGFSKLPHLSPHLGK